VATDPLTKSTISKYGRALESAFNDLENAKSFFSKRDSDQYKNLKDKVKKTMENISAMEGKDMSKLNKEFKELKTYVDAYVTHCKENKRTDSTRMTRLNAADALNKLCNMAEKGSKEPKKEMQDEIATRIATQGLVNKKIELTEANVARAKNMLMDSKKFKVSFGRMNICKLAKAARQKTEELFKGFENFVKGISAEPAKQQTVEAKVAQENVL